MITISDMAVLARSMQGPLANEARLRCAIGRAYYSAFHCCVQAADQWCGNLTQKEEENKGTHEKLYTRLENHSKHKECDAELSFLAEEAKKLRNLRTTADYKLASTINNKDVLRSFQYMDNVHGSFKKISDLTKPQ